MTDTRTHIASVGPDGGVEAGASSAVTPWWSFTKTLIAAAVLRLADEGRVALDAPLAPWAFTPRQLLGQRAGLPDYGGMAEYHAAVARGDAPWSDDAVLARFPPDRLDYAPGEGWAYSNIGYLLLRRLVEERREAAFPEALTALVLRPLGLDRARAATGPEDIAGTAFDDGRGYHPGWVFHGVVVGPVDEAALALHRLLTGDVLSPEAQAAMRTRHALRPDQASAPWSRPGYGGGVMIGEMRDGDVPALWVIGHSAGGPGSTGSVFHHPQSGRTAAAYTNDPARGANERAAYRRLAGLG